MVMRFCEACQQQRAIREFDLTGDQVIVTCRGCASERTRVVDPSPTPARREQITALERQRRSLIAALVKIDAEIAELRGRPATTSSSFERVDPSDVFDGAEVTDVFGD
jgi:hypothetical protein